MPDGSSSAAPVIEAGPQPSQQRRRGFGRGEGAVAHGRGPRSDRALASGSHVAMLCARNRSSSADWPARQFGRFLIIRNWFDPSGKTPVDEYDRNKRSSPRRRRRRALSSPAAKQRAGLFDADEHAPGAASAAPEKTIIGLSQNCAAIAAHVGAELAELVMARRSRTVPTAPAMRRRRNTSTISCAGPNARLDAPSPI